MVVHNTLPLLTPRTLLSIRPLDEPGKRQQLQDPSLEHKAHPLGDYNLIAYQLLGDKVWEKH